MNLETIGIGSLWLIFNYSLFHEPRNLIELQGLRFKVGLGHCSFE